MIPISGISKTIASTTSIATHNWLHLLNDSQREKKHRFYSARMEFTDKEQQKLFHQRNTSKYLIKKKTKKQNQPEPTIWLWVCVCFKRFFCIIFSFSLKNDTTTRDSSIHHSAILENGHFTELQHKRDNSTKTSPFLNNDNTSQNRIKILQDKSK